METLLLITGIIAVAWLLFRPSPQPQIIYVPVEVPTAQGGGLGCLPLIVIGVVLLLALGMAGIVRI